MNKIKIFVLAAFAAVLCSCVNDLNVTPIDPNTALPEDVLSTEQAYFSVLAQCYAGLAESSSQGVDSDPNIHGVDGGYGQYMRALFNLNELTTDEAACCWDDQTIHDLHRMCWTTSDVFIMSMYARIFFQISVCNEMIRQAQNCGINSASIQMYIAEARALRALSYYHAIDMFGNVPFSTENDPIGVEGPEQISRADLYKWLVEEIKDFTPALMESAGAANYGRFDQYAAKMLLAKVYLNAEVYTNGAVSAWNECAAVCKEVMAKYPTLHANWKDLFCASNEECTDEIIFAVQSDPFSVKSYGNTTYIIKASVAAGAKDWTAALGVGDGWGGLTVTPEFINSFDKSDARFAFTDGTGLTSKDEVHSLEMTDDYTFAANGWCSIKFTNLYADGTTPKEISFPSTDYPVFRAADAYLMYAECTLHGAGSAAEGQAAMDKVRERAGMPSVTLNAENLLKERGYELYWENYRRSDLIRFGKYVGDDQAVWSYKGYQGGSETQGQKVADKWALFPIPASEVNASNKITQNAGY